MTSRVSPSHRVERKLRKLEHNYRSDETLERLEKYVEEVEDLFEAEIDSGRIADTPALWADVYERMLSSVQAKMNSWKGNLALRLMRTGGFSQQEKANSEEARRKFGRLKAALEQRLADARVSPELKDVASDPATHRVSPTVDRRHQLISSCASEPERIATWDDELKHISRAARAKRRYREEDARKAFPHFTLWQAIDNSNLTETRRTELFGQTCQQFAKQPGRFELIGELTGRSAASAYDMYKKRPNRKKRSSKK